NGSVTDQQTPAGGVRTTELWYDIDGRPCAPADAVQGEIWEWDEDDVVISGTHMDLRSKPLGEAGSGLEPDNTDLGKGTWDVWAVDGAGRWLHPAATLEELLAALGWDRAPLEEQRRNVANLTALPAWVPAPDELKEEVRAWLVSTR